VHPTWKAGLFAAALCASLGASAQTTAAGPYYATPLWDQQLPGATRFVVLSNWNSEAVLDRETGLVWERNPGVARKPYYVKISYFNSIDLCVQSRAGGRKGWRVPTISELQSLFDPSIPAGGLALPVGHPFIGIERSEYWSTTVVADYADAAYVQSFDPAGTTVSQIKAYELRMWCVRGPGGGDGH
jgi:hypothetical protein